MREGSFAMPACVLWDFNGTVLDDVAVCVAAANHMLRSRGIAPVDAARYREIFTFPVINYYRALGLDIEREGFGVLAQEFMALYQPASLTAPLRRETVAAIGRLAEMGVRQVLLSASERGNLVAQLAHFGMTDTFDAVLALDNIYARSKADIAGAWMRGEDLDPKLTVLVGDTAHDAQVARELCCSCALLEGGHQSQARLADTGASVFSDAAAWLAAIECEPGESLCIS